MAKLNRYLYRNSYLYKWGKLLWRSPVGRVVILSGVVAVSGYFGWRWLEREQVKGFVRHWQQAENRGDYAGFLARLDLSPSNPDRHLFPDWRAEFFDADVQLQVDEMTVFREDTGFYRVAAAVRFLRRGETINRFLGTIFIRRRPDWKIVRVEI